MLTTVQRKNLLQRLASDVQKVVWSALKRAGKDKRENENREERFCTLN